jgi:hypothetical protein
MTEAASRGKLPTREITRDCVTVAGIVVISDDDGLEVQTQREICRQLLRTTRASSAR